MEEYIIPYIKSLSNNENDLLFFLKKLVLQYSKKFPGANDVPMDEQIEMVANYLDKANDKDNPNINEFFIDPEMNGKLDNQI